MSKLLTSRRFVLALLFVVYSLLIQVLPPSGDQLVMQFFPYVAFVVIASLLAIGTEDAVKAWKTEQPVDLADAIRAIVDELLKAQVVTEPVTKAGDDGKG